MAESWDAVIIGGGPAGAASAITAQRLGCRVLVLEAEFFPRHHIGESLVYIWRSLETLGVAEVMDATFQHKRGATRIWGPDSTIRSTDFGSVVGSGNRPHSLQVERSLFDCLLLERAAAVGATIRQGHRVTDVLWEGDRAVGVRYRSPSGDEHEVRVPLIVDASGRQGFIARQLGVRVVDPFYPDLSVYAYFRDAKRLEGELSGNLLIEAVPWGWFWYIPLHTGEISVGLVSDPSSRRELRTQGLQGFLAQAIAQSSKVREMLAEARIGHGPYATASYGYTSRRYCGPGWLLAGDAGSFVDPMWSTGVENALHDGQTAGAVVEAVVGGRIPEDRALAYYDRYLALRETCVHELVRFVYGWNRVHKDQPFWRRRHGYADTPSLSPRLALYLTQDTSTPYYRQAFRGMGVDDEIMALTHADKHFPTTDTLPSDFMQRIPRWQENVKPRDCVGLSADGRLEAGTEIVRDEVALGFSTKAYLGRSLHAIDGRRPLTAVVDEGLEEAPPGNSVTQRIQLGGLLAHVYRQGFMQLLPPAMG